MKKLFFAVLAALVLTAGTFAAPAPPEVAAPSAILVERTSGTVLYEKNSHEKLAPASVTKIMTMLLICDAVDAGRVSLEDTVTVSEYAAGMGGSQMYMEPGETHTVAQLMEGVAMASANDGCVAFKKETEKGERAII